jgi:hypothetical protein
MRAYLLGLLPDDQAAALEEEYFVNRASLLTLKSAEEDLIGEYLAGRLPPAEKRHFEKRYLHVPELRRRVEEVRREHIAAQPVVKPSFWNAWRLALAATPVLVVFAFAVWGFRSHQAKPAELVASGPTPQTGPPLSIRISPGSTKGVDSKSVQFEQPASGSIVNLILELPGQTSTLRCKVRISSVEAEGGWLALWNSPEPVVSTRTPTGQALTLPIGSSLFRPGDYVVEAWTSDGQFSATYVYRVTGPPR